LRFCCRRTEAASREINFREIDSRVLQRVIEYCYHKRKYLDQGTDAPQMAIPDFHIAPEMALELLMAANFLDV
jgi:elongin-C